MVREGIVGKVGGDCVNMKDIIEGGGICVHGHWFILLH